MKKIIIGPALNEFTSHENAILNSQTASYWLKRQIRDSYQRDVLDAWKDAEMLAQLLKARYTKAVLQ